MNNGHPSALTLLRQRTRTTALSFRTNILEPFGTVDPMARYVCFRGAEPKIEPLLRKRGLEIK